MKKSKYLPKLKFWFWALVFGAYSVTAAGVMIHALVGGDHGELSQVAVTTVDSPAEARIGGAAQVAAVYRAQSGTPFSTLPPGSTFQIIWPDGSSEYVTVVSQSSAAGVQLLPGTQLHAPQNMSPVDGLQIVPLSSGSDAEAEHTPR